MDIVMQRMTITNVEADMDRLIKVIFTCYIMHYTCYTSKWSSETLCIFVVWLLCELMICVFNNVTVQQ